MSRQEVLLLKPILLSWPPCDISSIESRFKCSHPKCKKIIVNPHQADDCGCRFCFQCMDEL